MINVFLRVETGVGMRVTVVGVCVVVTHSVKPVNTTSFMFPTVRCLVKVTGAVPMVAKWDRLRQWGQ